MSDKLLFIINVVVCKSIAYIKIDKLINVHHRVSACMQHQLFFQGKYVFLIKWSSVISDETWWLMEEMIKLH